MRWLLLTTLLLLPSVALAQGPDSSMAAAVDRQMSGGPFNHPEHVEHTPARTATRSDSLRARALVDSARTVDEAMAAVRVPARIDRGWDAVREEMRILDPQYASR